MNLTLIIEIEKENILQERDSFVTIAKGRIYLQTAYTCFCKYILFLKYKYLYSEVHRIYRRKTHIKRKQLLLGYHNETGFIDLIGSTNGCT